MKTLHLTNAWHASSGGVGTFYKALFEAANREGHSMSLVVPGDSTRIENAGEFGRIYYIEAPLAPLDRNYRMLYPYRFLFPGTAIQRIINRERPGLIEISEKYSLPYLGGLVRTGRLPGVSVRPVVVGVSHERMDENVAAWLDDGTAARRFCHWYMKSIYFPMFDHHITVSEHTAEELIRASRGHKVRRGIWISPMGVDCETFTPRRRSAEGRKTLLRNIGAGEETTILLYVGRLSPEKNGSLLIESMERLKSSDYRLLIAGAGTQRGEMQRECERRNIHNVSFLGHIEDRNALADLYANADIFVHPNPKEPFGIAPLEAMASGLALIAPNSGGVTSYATRENAWLVDADPDRFACAARFIRSHPATRIEKTILARETACAFGWPAVTSRYLQLYRELIAITHDRGVASEVPPLSWSTPGDFLGREIPIGH
ncbi:MAG: glycosyltransferase [Bryobacteraceae bacterium]|jgi:alpha-1,6-mannosyltransferase